MLQDLKTRFRAQAATQRGKPSGRGGSTSRPKQQGKHSHDISELLALSTVTDRSYVPAPPLPIDQKPDKPEKEGMQDFLDDLLG